MLIELSDEHWQTLRETLECDSGASYIERTLRQEITEALAGVREVEPRIVITMEGGLISDLHTNIELEALVVDYDVEGTSDVALHVDQGNGKTARACVIYYPSFVDAGFVNKRWCEFEAAAATPQADRVISIPAEAHTDDYKVEVKFDAREWFVFADDAEIRALIVCGFGGDYPADQVAVRLASSNLELKDLFQYLSIVNRREVTTGFECHVDEEAAIAWLKQNRPTLLEKYEDKA